MFTKLITKDQTIVLKNTCNLFPKDISANDIRIETDKDVDLEHLNFNIVKYNLDRGSVEIFIKNSSINKLVLNGYKVFVIKNSIINNIYIQSEVMKLEFMNSNIPNLHDKVDLINQIIIIQ